MIWFILLAALIMPVMAFLLFKYRGDTGVDPIQFYKWSAFGYTLFIFLPVVFGILCTMLIHEEKQKDVLKQLWIVPVSKTAYFFSKFFVVLFYSVAFMMITAIASVLFSVLPGYVAFDWGSVLYLLERCFEIGVLAAFAMLPILAIASSRKGYILPVCVTLVYAFCGFIFMSLKLSRKMGARYGEEKVIQLLKEYGFLIRVPVEFEGDEGHRRIHDGFIPWRQSFCSGEEIMQFGEMMFEEEFFGVVPIVGEGLRGYAFISERQTSAAAMGRHKTFLKHMLITEDGKELIPKWAFLPAVFSMHKILLQRLPGRDLSQITNWQKPEMRLRKRCLIILSRSPNMMWIN